MWPAVRYKIPLGEIVNILVTEKEITAYDPTDKVRLSLFF